VAPHIWASDFFMLQTVTFKTLPVSHLGQRNRGLANWERPAAVRREEQAYLSLLPVQVVGPGREVLLYSRARS